MIAFGIKVGRPRPCELLNGHGEVRSVVPVEGVNAYFAVDKLSEGEDGAAVGEQELGATREQLVKEASGEGRAFAIGVVVHAGGKEVVGFFE